MPNKETSARYKEMGMCSSCGKRKPKKGKSTCEGCLQPKKEQYQTRIKNKLCVRCGEPARPNRVHCDSCAKKEREKDRINKKTKRERKFKSKDDYVVCPICKKKFKVITNTHLRSHNTTISKFKKEHPSINLWSQKYKEETSKNRKDPSGLYQSKEYKKKKSKQAKERYNDPNSFYHSKTFLKQCSIRSKSLWQDPDYVKLVFDATHTKAYKDKLSKMSKKRWQNKKFHDRMIKILHSPESIKKRSISLEKTANTKFKHTSIEKKIGELLNNLDIEFYPLRNIPTVNKYLKHFHIFDFVVYDKKIAIEADGCWWHCCKKCYSNSRFNKYGLDYKQQRKRDREINKATKKAGWKMLRFWEHDIKKKPEKVEKKLRKVLKG